MQKKYVESLNEFTNAILLAPEGWPEKPKLYCNRAAAYMMLNRCVRHRGSQSWAATYPSLPLFRCSMTQVRGGGEGLRHGHPRRPHAAQGLHQVGQQPITSHTT